MSSIKFLLVIILIISFILYLTFTSPSASYSVTYSNIEVPDSILNFSLRQNLGYKWLEELCNIGPRLSGSEKSKKAIDWAYNKFLEIGCDTVWLQPVKVPHWNRGDYEKAYINSTRQNEKTELNIASLGGSIGTGNSPVTGKVLKIDHFDDLKYLDTTSTKGKIFFFNEAFDDSEIETFKAYGKAVKQRISGASEAARLGGIAVLVRSITSKYDDVPHVGTLIYADSVKQIPAAAIGQKSADLLAEKLTADPNLEISIELDCANLPEIQSYNVIAEIKGEELPDEIVLVGGHFDSWDKGQGAHDDGAPSIQTMEVLKQFIQLKLHPRRTVRCVLFINEENGSRGAKEYAKYSDSTNQNHIAAIESDRGAFEPRGFTISADEKILERFNSWLPYLKNAQIDWIRKGGSGADISKIKNVPALIGFVPDDQKYFDVHHSDNDVFESVNKREMQLGTAAISILTYLICQEGI